MTRRRRNSQLPLFQAPRPAVDTRVWLQLRSDGKFCTKHPFDSLRDCAGFLLTDAYNADEAVIIQRNAQGMVVLFTGGYIEDARQWAQKVTVQP